MILTRPTDPISGWKLGAGRVPRNPTATSPPGGICNAASSGCGLLSGKSLQPPFQNLMISEVRPHEALPELPVIGDVEVQQLVDNDIVLKLWRL